MVSEKKRPTEANFNGSTPNLIDFFFTIRFISMQLFPIESVQPDLLYLFRFQRYDREKNVITTIFCAKSYVECVKR
jgi:hypothetical protein